MVCGRPTTRRCVPRVVDLELPKLPFQITGIPKQHLVEEFSPDRPNQALHERV
jgi:hypothetical protein